MSHMPTTLQPDSSSSQSASLTNASGVLVVACTPVICSSPGSFSKAQAATAAGALVVGLTQSDVAVGADGNIQLSGSFTAQTSQWDAIAGTSGGLTFATWYFLDAGTPGRMTSTPPSGVGQYVTAIGVALSETVLDIRREPPIGPIP